MGFTPTEGKYSARELMVLNIIPTGKRAAIPTTELTRRYYGGHVPLNGQITIMGVVRSLVAKLALNKQKRRIARSKRTGPNPMLIWLE